MKLETARIENFKGIDVVEISSKGNNIILKGPNGSCKTATLQAIATLLFGKKVLPDDPILHGKESAMMECTLSDEGEVKYKIKVNVKPGNQLKIEVFTFTPSGHELSVKKPVNFLSTLVTRDFIDPDEFVKKKPVDRIKMLYSLLPVLREQSDDIDAKKIEEQQKRSDINSEKTRIAGQLANNPFTAGLPEEEQDPVELMEKLELAQEHNKTRETMESDIESISENISYSKEQIGAAEEEIKALENQISLKRGRIQDIENQIDTASEILEQKKKSLDEFIEAPIDEIKEEISKLSEKNAAIRKNQEHNRLQKEMQRLSAEYSEGLTRMNKLDQDKIDLFKNAKMPIEGLSILEDDIAYPDPRTGEVVKFGSLSTGQQYTVSVPILASFLPESKVGLRAMIINDMNAIDDVNLPVVIKAAKENDVQMIFHRTTKTTESNKLKIEIC